MYKTRRYGGFSSINKLCVGVVLLLIALVIGSLPSNQLKSKTRCRVKCSSEGDQIPIRAIERIAQNRYAEWAANPLVVEAVKAANSKQARTLGEIIQLDDKWIEGTFDGKWLGELLDNPCARYLKQLQNENGGRGGMYSEIFVMDRQGCIIAESGKTSDYWQGDEDKFVKAFVDGEGAIFVDEADYDESTQTSLIQVSVPVIDPETEKAIGVMTIGLNVRILFEEI
jgi:hypothetical protein